ncbi:MAG: glycosyltransferase family 2 protein [Verrucomicrobiales bacterium]
MRLAVVIPLYNHETFIAETLESVLAQSRHAARILVLDDGSTDRSLEVARRFESRGVEVWTQPNSGVSATVRTLLERASADCELIATLDSDDLLAPDRLARTVPLFEDDPQVQLLVTGLRLIDADGHPLAADHPRRRWVEAVWSRWEGADTDLVAWLGQANFAVSNSNFIARREFFRSYPAKPYRFSYDYYLLLRAALAGGLRVLPDPLLDYRLHGANTMNTEPAPLLREQLRLWLELHRDLAPDLQRDVDLRQRFYRLMRAAWNNVSSLHAGALQVLLAHCAASLPSEEIAALPASLDSAHWPELTRYPNAPAVNLATSSSPLNPEAGALSEALQSLRDQRDEARRQAAAQRDLARLRQRLLSSRRVAVARALGLGRDLSTDAGRTPEEKLAALRAAVGRHPWSRHLSADSSAPTDSASSG